MQVLWRNWLKTGVSCIIELVEKVLREWEGAEQ